MSLPLRGGGHDSGRALGTILTLILSAAGSTSTAQDAKKPDTNVAAAAADGNDTWLRVVDTEFGYELTVPAGWQYDQSRVPSPDGAIAIFRGVAPGAARTLEIRVFRGERVTDFDRWCTGYEQQLRRAQPGNRTTARSCAAGLRPATRLSVSGGSGKAGASESLVVLADPMTVLVCVLTGAETAAGATAAELDRIAATLRFVASPVDPVATEEDLRRGRALIGVLRRGAEQVEISPETLYFVVSLEGRPTGYRTRRFARAERDTGNRLAPDRRLAGIQFLEQEWTFATDGTVRLEGVDAFASFDGQLELLETRTVQIPPAPLSSLRPLIRLDQCVREGDRLVSSVSRNLEQDLPTPRPPILLDANYLSRAWLELLPGFLAEVPDQPHLFTCYDSRQRALRPYSIVSQGKPEAGADRTSAADAGSGPSAPGDTYLFECSDEFGRGPGGKIWTSRTGALLRAETGAQTLTRSTAAEIKSSFGPRQADAERRLYDATARSKANEPAKEPRGD